MADIADLGTTTTLNDTDTVVLQPAFDVEPVKMTGAAMRTAFKGDPGDPGAPGTPANPADITTHNASDAAHAAAITDHDARPESHENGIIGNIRLHDRNAIPNEDQTHQDIRNLLSAHEGTPHGGGGAGITLEQARDAIAAVLVGGTNVTVDYVDDGAGVGSITVNAAGSGLTTEGRPRPYRGGGDAWRQRHGRPLTMPPTPSPSIPWRARAAG